MPKGVVPNSPRQKAVAREQILKNHPWECTTGTKTVAGQKRSSLNLPNYAWNCEFSYSPDEPQLHLLVDDRIEEFRECLKQHGFKKPHVTAM